MWNGNIFRNNDWHLSICVLSTRTGLWGNTMSIRLANFDHKASLSLREPHKLGWKLADHIPRDGLATELLVFEQFVYLHCNHRTLWTKVRADKQLLWFSCHLRLRQSHDSDCHVSLSQCLTTFLMSPSPDTGTQTRHQYPECHSSMMSVTSCYVGQGQSSTDGDITWEKKREKHLGSCVCFIQWTVSWSDDKSYGPNTSNTFQSLSPAIHFIGIWLSTRPKQDQDIYLSIIGNIFRK